MSILSAIKNFAYEALGIEKNTEVSSASADKESAVKKTPVIQCENTGKNVDTVEIKQKNGNEPVKKNLGQLKQSIELKCRANGINYNEIIKNVNEIAGMTKEQYEALPEEKKEEILGYVDSAVDKAIQLKKKYGASEQTNSARLIACDAKNRYEAVKSGEFADAQEVDKEVGDVNAELGDDFKKLPLKERRSRMEAYRMRKKAEFESRLKEKLEKLPESQRADAEAKLRKRYSYITRGRFIDVVHTNDSETALNAIPMLEARDIKYGAQTILDTRCDKQERTRVADMADFDFTESLAESYYNFGEELPPEALKEYTSVMVSAKSSEAVFQYQKDYAEARNRYENGEDTPPYLDDEFFTSTAQGIGEGAVNNVNMTTEEKAEFLVKWENDAKQYDDYKEVTENVKKEIRANEKLLSEYEKNKNSAEEKQTFNEPAPTKAETAPAPITNTIKTENITTQKSEKQTVQNKTVTPVIKNNTNPAVVTKTIKNEGIEKAVKKYSPKEVISAVLNDSSLKHLRPQLASMIKSYDYQTLREITSECSNSAFVFICSIVSRENFAKLTETKNDLCYSARKQVENIKEKYETVR